MTTHLDDQLLAEWAAAGEQPDAAATEHLQLCSRCRESLDDLRQVAELTGDLPRLEQPPADVWQRVRDELELSEVAEPTRRADAGRRTGFRRRSLVLAAAVAAIVGLGAGIVGTLALTDNQPTVEAAIRLEPLQGKSGDGTADLVRSPAGNELKIAAAGLNAASGFYEVWLINTDGKRMVSLGVLNPTAGGTFQIPGTVTAQGYRIVDISLEPNDGNPEHSHNSIIRGTLPA